MGPIVMQVANAVLAIAAASGACFAYFWGSNWLLDRLLGGRPAVASPGSPGGVRSAIRPWLFLAPALIFLSLYLIYPVVETFRLSFFDKTGTFVGLGTYQWAFGDPGFQQAVLNNILWLAIVPAVATAFGLVIAVLADRALVGQLAKSLVFMPMAISFVSASVIWKFVYDYRAPMAPIRSGSSMPW